MASLLVSVRSGAEARAAIAGGAAIVDVKEPSRGSLGMADLDTWREVRTAIPGPAILSVALGELSEWTGSGIPSDGWAGIRYRKIGLAGADIGWRDRWADLRRQYDPGPRPAWVAVVYLDWESARAPAPLAVIDEAATIGECEGVLFDTWDKSRGNRVDPVRRDWIDRVKDSGRFVALAGSLDEAAIRRFRAMGPDLFAVRGAACEGGDRRRAIDPGRVARLVRAAGS